jgi:outer membrane protein, multidrug efflux system
MIFARVLILCGVALAGLSGCAVTSTSVGDDLKLPEEWRNAGNFPLAEPDRDLSRWWGRFDDPTLNKLIECALQDSPDVRTAVSRVREARANRDSQRAALFPSLDGGASGNARRSRTDGAGTTSANAYSAGLDASWEVDLFGRNRSSVEAATANLAAAGEELNSVHASLAAEVAAAYTTLRANEAKLVVLKQNITTREETAQLAAWRLKAGEADSLEATQSQSSLESARAGLPALEQAIGQGKNDLALLAGQTPGALDKMLARSRGVPVPPSSLALGIPADVLRQRPDVRTAGHQVLAAAASTRATEATRYPSLNLSGSLGLDTLSTSKLFDPESAAASIAASIASPIFDAGRIKANIEAAPRRRGAGGAELPEDGADRAFRHRERDHRLPALRGTPHHPGKGHPARPRGGPGRAPAIRGGRNRLPRRARFPAHAAEPWRTALLSTRTDRTTAYIRLYQALGGGWSAGS